MRFDPDPSCGPRLRRVRAGAACLLVALLATAASPRRPYEPRNGDVVFHASRSSQSRAVQLATRTVFQN